MQSRLLIILLFFVFQVGVAQELKTPAIFSDNMVLQQKSNAPVWGWNAPGKEVSVTGSWNHKTVKATTDQSGKWTVKLKTPAAGGPYTLTVSSDKVITFQNVMIGEVWVCSGQSNMEMPMVGWTNMPIEKSEATIRESSNYPNIRLFNLQKKIAESPQSDCIGHWAVNSPESVAPFSATGYFFGLELCKKLNIPVGLIMTAWGGTPSQAWTSAEDIARYDAFKPAIAKLTNKELRKNDSINYVKAVANWQAKVSVDNAELPGSAQQWMNGSLDDSQWNQVAVPEGWKSDAKLRNTTGIFWLRKTIEIPKAWEGKDLSVELGPIDEVDVVWLNGERLGEHSSIANWNVPRKYILPSDKVKAGQNVIAIRVTNTIGAGGLVGNASQLKIYPVQAGDSRAISLAGDWKYKIDADLAKLPAFPQNGFNMNANYPSVLFNGMINPLIPFAIKGAIWYQGEANVYNAKQYAQIFPEMVKCWRSKWNQGDFPFYYVQIAPYEYGPNSKSELLRESQLQSLKTIPNSGMAVTMDIAMAHQIHPPYKEAVGTRLADWAFAKNYGLKNVAYSGPLYKSMKIEGQSIRLSFDFAKHGLVAKGGELTYFEIAGSDGKFQSAKAVIDNNTVVVSSPAVTEPVAVRYGWSNTAMPNLFNQEGLPASSFRTDNWEK